jgi:hypothetical protein
VSTLQFDWTTFEADFARAAIVGINHLATRCSGETFYCVAVYCDSCDGDFGIYADSEESFLQTLEYYRTKYPGDYVEDSQLSKLRTNSGNFFFNSFHPDSRGFIPRVDELLDKWNKLVHELSYEHKVIADVDHRRFAEIGCSVARFIENSADLQQLPISPDFRMQVCEHDEPDRAGFDRYDWWKEHGNLHDFDAWKDFGSRGKSELS